jgi:hypothetical protein
MNVCYPALRRSISRARSFLWDSIPAGDLLKSSRALEMLGGTWRRQTALNLMPHENMQQKKTGANVT